MNIEKTAFGTLEDGTTTELYTLTNSKGVRAGITNYGATLVSLFVPNREGKLEDVVLGFDSIEGYRSDAYLKVGPYFGATVGRFANRIAKGRFSLDGKEYTLAVNNPPNHLHGGLKGFDKALWKASAFTSEHEVGVVMQHVSPEGDEGYPGALAVQVLFSLSDDDALTIQYQAHTDAPTLLNLTNHAYFNLRGGSPLQDVLAHEVMIAADSFLPINADLIPLGEFRPVANTVFDFRQPMALGKHIEAAEEQLQLARGYDHCYVLNPRQEDSTAAATVYEPHSGRFLEVFTTEPGVQLYTANFLTGKLRGKGGTVYEERYGLCLETQHFPDSPNQAHFPSVVLKPGETFNSSTAYRFSVR